MTFEEYKATHRLDNARYKIIGAVEQGKSWIIVQQAQPPAEPHYCLQYAGSGHYFSTLDELNQYSRKRWGREFAFNGGVSDG